MSKLHGRWRRTITVLLVLMAAISLFAASPAAGASSFVFRAGTVCAFDVQLADEEQPQDGSVREHARAAVNADITITNLETGATYLWSSRYTGTETLIRPQRRTTSRILGAHLDLVLRRRYRTQRSCRSVGRAAGARWHQRVHHHQEGCRDCLLLHGGPSTQTSARCSAERALADGERRGPGVTGHPSSPLRLRESPRWAELDTGASGIRAP